MEWRLFVLPVRVTTLMSRFSGRGVRLPEGILFLTTITANFACSKGNLRTSCRASSAYSYSWQTMSVLRLFADVQVTNIKSTTFFWGPLMRKVWACKRRLPGFVESLGPEMILDTLNTAPGRRGRESRRRLGQEGDTSSSSHTPLRINLRGRCRVSAGPVPSLKGFSCKTASWSRNPSVSSLLLKDPSVWNIFLLYLNLPSDTIFNSRTVKNCGRFSPLYLAYILGSKPVKNR